MNTTKPIIETKTVPARLNGRRHRVVKVPGDNSAVVVIKGRWDTNSIPCELYKDRDTVRFVPTGDRRLTPDEEDLLLVSEFDHTDQAA